MSGALMATEGAVVVAAEVEVSVSVEVELEEFVVAVSGGGTV